MKQRDFKLNPQLSIEGNIVRLHRHIRSIAPGYKPTPAEENRRRMAALHSGRKWIR